ncbi:MAG: asparagine--tRNA ligase [Clostridiales bacterium]|jgi:asparaginyl-tRNA synthetase|nr:asparagine--tRNA ligase [Clostridiales bacterium]
MRTKISAIFRDSQAFLGQELLVCGWVRTLRDNNHFGFIELNDGSYFKSIQIVFEERLENFAEVAKLGAGAALRVRGKLVESQGKGQAFEISATEISIEGEAPPEYPLQKKRHSFEYLRTIAHLRPRTNTFSAVFRLRSIASFALHKFFNDRGFVYVHSPVITGLDAEGAGEMFPLAGAEEFFGKNVSLTVTGQLNAEAYALAFGDVYTFGPTFRAENSNTTRHLAEFWMLEPEIAFADLDDCMTLIEDMVKFTTNYCLEHAPEEMAFFDKFIEKGLLDRLKNVVESDFGRISYTEAIEALQNSGQKFEFPVSWGCDLQTEHERYISEILFKKPVFVTDYPKEIKAFYMRRNDDGKTIAGCDLLVPGIGEIVGGSQREERFDMLKAVMEENGISTEEMAWYLDLRRFGGAKHSGFGLGFERFLMFISGMTNIRDVIPFPRTPNNAEF